MNKYIIVGLLTTLLFTCWLYKGARNDLADARANLAVAENVNKANAEAIARLERSIINTDAVLAGWSKDRATLAGVRDAARTAIKEAIRDDETFKDWASGSVPPDAWRLLRDADNRKDGTGGAIAPDRADGAVR